MIITVLRENGMMVYWFEKHRLATKYNLYNLQIYLFLILGIYVSILLSSSNVVVTFKCLRIRPFEVWKILRYIDGFDHKNRWKYVFIKGNDLNRYGKKKNLAIQERIQNKFRCHRSFDTKYWVIGWVIFYKHLSIQSINVVYSVHEGVMFCVILNRYNARILRIQQHYVFIVIADQR